MFILRACISLDQQNIIYHTYLNFHFCLKKLLYDIRVCFCHSIYSTVCFKLQQVLWYMSFSYGMQESMIYCVSSSWNKLITGCQSRGVALNVFTINIFILFYFSSPYRWWNTLKQVCKIWVHVWFFLWKTPQFQKGVFSWTSALK